MRTTSEQGRAAAKLGALGSAVVLGTFVVGNHVEEANKAAEEIASSLERMSALMKELAGGSPKQPAAIDQVRKAIAQTSAATERHLRSLNEAAASAKAMKEHAQHVAQLLAQEARGTNAGAERRKGK